jgi:trigger factor
VLTTTSERLEGDMVKLIVTVSADEVDAAIEKTYANANAEVRIPGFRKGHAPRPVIDNFFGKGMMLAQVTEAVVNESYHKAIDLEELRTVEAPEIEELDTVEPGQPFTYQVEVAVRPEWTIGDEYKSITVEVPDKEVTDADIDVLLEEVRSRFAELEPVEDRGVEAEDFVLLSFVGYVDGEAYEGNTVDKYLYQMGSGVMPFQFDDGLLGTKAGEEARVEFAIPDTSSKEEYVGKTAQFDVTVHEIKAKKLPAVDEELAANAGFDSVEEMREQLKERATLQKLMAWEYAKERGIREAIEKMVDGEVPKPMIDSRKSSIFNDFVTRLEAQGTSLEAYTHQMNLSSEDLDKMVSEQAEQVIRQDLALEAVFRATGQEVTEEDVDEELGQIAEATKSTKDEAREKWQEAGLMAVIREGVMQRKAMAWLMENCKETVIVEGADDATEPVAEPAAATSGE